ncbi:hypothetical protein RHMOL_Rhmol07G0306300 [Rhododendron molle]|uniref:Uncharacterized protein n=1 Tax=Rhododendron molle TaxID=49168 RepID=A0ACC0N7J2_RHOML|nr:hypothetical protein RHMOL_Rhmol07G0306300 [Rhododendron molle]
MEATASTFKLLKASVLWFSGLPPDDSMNISSEGGRCKHMLHHHQASALVEQRGVPSGSLTLFHPDHQQWNCPQLPAMEERTPT